jgi:ABC-type lipoprotein release transport system permease subunit
MIEKVENAYLAILRTVVIAASGIMLLAALVFAASATTGLWSGVNKEIKAPDIDAAAIIRSVTEPASPKEPSVQTSREKSAVADAVDPNQQHYDRAADAIVAFAASQPESSQVLDKGTVAKVVKQRAERFNEEHLTEAFAKGFARSIERMLKDKRIQARARDGSPVAVINELLDAYTEAFSEQVEAEQERISQGQLKAIERQANSIRFLTAAGVCFGVFLLIVFLSIFIKIEVNLRHLANAADQKRAG